MLPDPFRQELAFCPALAEMLSYGKTVASDGSEIAAHSMSTLNNLFTLKQLFIQQSPLRTLEVGLGHGASCALFTALHQSAGQPPQGQHTAIDPYQNTDWKDAAPRLLERAHLSDYFHLLRQPSSLALPTLIQQEPRFGLIYIDGSHLFEDVFVDFYFCRQLLTSNGIIAFDDCASPHIAKVLAYINRSLSQSFEEIDLSPMRADRGQSPRYRLGKMMGKTQMRAFRLIDHPLRPVDAAFINF